MADFESLNVCPACRGTSLQNYKKGNFDFLSLGSEQIKITDSAYGRIWNLSRCLSCDHIFANPCPTPEFIDSLYNRVEDPLYEAEATGRARNFARLLQRLEKIRPRKGCLFDVGAATGILLHLAQSRGWIPEGIEASSWAVRRAKERYGLAVREDFFETARLPLGRYDAVTIIDFIEHTPRPFDALAAANRILTGDGLICLVTPDIHSLAARIAGKKWWHFRPAHLAYFSRQSLCVVLERAGFKVLRSRRYSWTFSAHYLLTRRNSLPFLLRSPNFASLLKRIPVKLALGDSFEIYAGKAREA